jgi:cellulose biosynthesis protein BcsQ
MRKIAVQSQKGGVGKTTMALLLAKFAAVEHGLRPCVLDFDFIGSGIANLLALQKKPSAYVEEYFLHGRVHEYDVKRLLGRYADPQLQRHEIGLMLHSGRGLPRGPKAKQEVRAEDEMLGMVANEPHYQVIHEKTKVLFDLLERDGFTIAIVDCHPGLGLVARAVRPLADLNIYVTTPNRTDCFGLLKDVNLRRWDDRRALLVVNRAEPPVTDLATLRRLLRKDDVLGPSGTFLVSGVKYMASDQRHVAFVAESERLRRCFYIGTKGLLPPIDPSESDFYGKAMALLKQKE